MAQSDKKEEKEKERESQKAKSALEKEKKQGGKAVEKLKFYGVVAFLSLLCAGFIWFIFKPDAPETVEGMAGINTTIPDAIAPETMADKQKAYELEEMKKRRKGKGKNLAGHGGGLSDTGHARWAEAGRKSAEGGCNPRVQGEAATDFTPDYLLFIRSRRKVPG